MTFIKRTEAKGIGGVTNYEVQLGVWASISARSEDEAIDKALEYLNHAHYNGHKEVYFKTTDPVAIEDV